ncbi:cytochrome P450 [Podospora appendiculata]|uniref:Cytochrome P450 n=1 Tax=Podospora appendiculata TaxID=314037 RepID=A0AAE0XLV0_9PEZI|nr:cytochrome P450 [Podospora appendiculata]
MDPNQSKQLTVAQLQSDAEDTLVAGSDTTATTLTYACVHLARQPDLLERLYREIKPVHGPANQIPALRPLESITLLTACVRESLRLASPSPSYLWHSGVPEEGHALHHVQQQIPLRARDRHVSVERALQRVPTSSRRPTSFKPSRWLGAANIGDNI